MAPVFSRRARLRPRAGKMFEQKVALTGCATIAQRELRWWYFLPQLLPDLADLHGQTGGVKTP